MSNTETVQKILDKYAIMRPGLAEEIVAALAQQPVSAGYFLRDKITPGEFNVTLFDFNRDRRIATIKAIREVAPMGLKEAKDATDMIVMGRRVTILAGVSGEYAREAVASLAEKGAIAKAHRFYEQLASPEPKVAQPSKSRRQIDLDDE